MTERIIIEETSTKFRIAYFADTIDIVADRILEEPEIIFNSIKFVGRVEKMHGTKVYDDEMKRVEGIHAENCPNLPFVLIAYEKKPKNK